MNRIFWGILFVVINLNFDIGKGSIDALPDFIGYLLLMKGMEAMSDEADAFDTGHGMSVVLVLYSAMMFVLNLLNPPILQSGKLWALPLIGAVLNLILLQYLVNGVEQIERDYKWKLGGGRLHALWNVQLVLLPAMFLTRSMELVSLLCGLGSSLVSLFFMISMYFTQKAYADCQK